MAADIAVIMGSKSDLPSLKGAFDTLKKFGLSFEARVLSAHRTPDAAAEYAKNAEERGIKIIICAAGMAGVPRRPDPAGSGGGCLAAG